MAGSVGVGSDGPRTGREPVAELSMFESLPFDEATMPARVSTGELPRPDDVQRLVTEAYQRYRSNVDGVFS